MSSLTGLYGGGGGGTPVNSIAQLFVGGQTQYTDESGGVWLKTGNTIPYDSTTYPDAFISDFVLAAVYEKLFSVSAQESNPTDIDFNSDGTKMFIIGSTGDDINEYSLSTAYDIATASFTTNSLVSGQTTLPLGLRFKPDGTKVYVVDNTSTVYQYSLSTAFDISTLSYDSVSFDASSQVTIGRSIEFNNDGTKIYIGGNYDAYQYSLSTAYDISTASYDSKSLNNSTAGFDGLRFNGNGSKLAVVDSILDRVIQYSLTTNYDISTAIKNFELSVTSYDTAPQGLAFSNNYTKMYVVGQQADNVNQFDCSSFMGMLEDTGTYDYIKLK